MYDWDLADPSVTAWVRLRQTWKALERVLDIQLDLSGTTLPQLDILEILGVSKESLTPSAMATHIFRERQSTSSLLGRMQKSGYVRKVRQGKDRRVVRIQMQPKGRELLDRAARSATAYGSLLLRSSLSREEMKSLDRLLKKLRDKALEELGLVSEHLPDTIDVPRGLDQKRANVLDTAQRCPRS